MSKNNYNRNRNRNRNNDNEGSGILFIVGVFLILLILSRIYEFFKEHHLFWTIKLTISLFLINLIVKFVLVNVFHKPNYSIKNIINGKLGELKVYINLKCICGNKAVILNNILLQTNDYSTEIDHLVICNNRDIICIETKNRGGKIEDNGDEKWKQLIGKNEFNFYSPHLQNQKHIEILDKFLKENNIHDYKLHNRVVFCNKNIHLISNRLNEVNLLKNLKNIIIDIVDPLNTPNTFKKDNVKDITLLIKKNNKSRSYKARQRHIRLAKRSEFRNNTR